MYKVFEKLNSILTKNHGYVQQVVLFLSYLNIQKRMPIIPISDIQQTAKKKTTFDIHSVEIRI